MGDGEGNMTSYTGVERRHEQPCEMVIGLSSKMVATDVKITDFIDRYERDRLTTKEVYEIDREESKEWRTSIEGGLTKLSNSIVSLSNSVEKMGTVSPLASAAKWAGIILATGFLGGMGAFIFELLKGKIHFG
jgi:hypothetical protein